MKKCVFGNDVCFWYGHGFDGDGVCQVTGNDPNYETHDCNVTEEEFHRAVYQLKVLGVELGFVEPDDKL